jgi:hypothetical protein
LAPDGTETGESLGSSPVCPPGEDDCPEPLPVSPDPAVPPWPGSGLAEPSDPDPGFDDPEPGCDGWLDDGGDADPPDPPDEPSDPGEPSPPGPGPPPGIGCTIPGGGAGFPGAAGGAGSLDPDPDPGWPAGGWLAPGDGEPELGPFAPGASLAPVAFGVVIRYFLLATSPPFVAAWHCQVYWLPGVRPRTHLTYSIGACPAPRSACRVAVPSERVIHASVSWPCGLTTHDSIAARGPT